MGLPPNLRNRTHAIAPATAGQRAVAPARAIQSPSISIVTSTMNAIMGTTQQGTFFPYTLKHRALKPSEIRALDFKGEFRRSAICSVSATIGINRSIPDVSTGAHLLARMSKYRRSLSGVSLFAIDLGGRCTTQSWVVRTKWLAPQRAPAGLGLPPKPHIRRVESTRRWEQ